MTSSKPRASTQAPQVLAQLGKTLHPPMEFRAMEAGLFRHCLTRFNRHERCARVGAPIGTVGTALHVHAPAIEKLAHEPARPRVLLKVSSCATYTSHGGSLKIMPSSLAGVSPWRFHRSGPCHGAFESWRFGTPAQKGPPALRPAGDRWRFRISPDRAAIGELCQPVVQGPAGSTASAQLLTAIRNFSRAHRCRRYRRR